MSSSETNSLSSYEWASAAQYIQYVSRVAGLEEINSDHINSFSLSRHGPDFLIARKNRTLASLLTNMVALEQFVTCVEGHRKSDELAIIRTMYVQFRRACEKVEEHIGKIKAYERTRQVAFEDFIREENERDDIPF